MQTPFKDKEFGGRLSRIMWETIWQTMERWVSVDWDGMEKGFSGSPHYLKKSGNVNFIMHSIILMSSG